MEKKELTIEEKAKRYDEVIPQLKGLLDGIHEEKCDIMEEDIIKIFHELKESEDEKIRKWLIRYFKEVCDNVSEKEKKGVLAWLEKQGEPIEINPSEFDSQLNKLLKQFETLPKEELASSLSFYLNVVQNNGTYKEENQSEQKPIFRVGDWVVVDGVTQQVKEIRSDGFDTDRAWNGKLTFKDLHLWTIQDAKPGDVLINWNNTTFIFKAIEDETVKFHIAYNENWDAIKTPSNKLSHMGLSEPQFEFHPATKEQRDLLFQKMKEAGYEWNDEKKELKIEQKLVIIIPKFKVGDIIRHKKTRIYL